jgi:hypothetical protein
MLAAAGCGGSEADGPRQAPPKRGGAPQPPEALIYTDEVSAVLGRGARASSPGISPIKAVSGAWSSCRHSLGGALGAIAGARTGWYEEVSTELERPGSVAAVASLVTAGEDRLTPRSLVAGLRRCRARGRTVALALAERRFRVVRFRSAARSRLLVSALVCPVGDEAFATLVAQVPDGAPRSRIGGPARELLVHAARRCN